MLQKNTIIAIFDNSDAKKVLCIHKYIKKKIYKQSNIGSTFLGSVKRRVKRKDLIKTKILTLNKYYTKIFKKNTINMDKQSICESVCGSVGRWRFFVWQFSLSSACHCGRRVLISQHVFASLLEFQKGFS